jgi:hypothetical protein
MMIIRPYRFGKVWVFDDAATGLVQEPFVGAVNQIIDRAVANIPNAETGFTLMFSANPFPGHQFKLERRQEENCGNWYYSPDFGIEGWLCPALFKYFTAAPKTIYVQCSV